jgi:hypothetical protein
MAADLHKTVASPLPGAHVCCSSQAQHDYLLGNYPVVREDAAQMCALQVQAEHASTLTDDEEGLMSCIEKYITKQVGTSEVMGWWRLTYSDHCMVL